MIPQTYWNAGHVVIGVATFCGCIDRHWLDGLRLVQISIVSVPLPPTINSLKKAETLYKVLTTSINPPYKFLRADGYTLGAIGCIGLIKVQ